VDIDEKKVEKMKNGIIPIYEPGLDVLFNRNTAEGRLKFTTNLAEGIKDAKVIFWHCQPLQVKMAQQI
jgi:UDPglucose 6-dehydrogenase